MNKVTKYSLGVALLAASGSSQALTCLGSEISIFGTPGPDVIQGTMARDVIHALGGHDEIRGAEGNDVICGGLGNDFVIAGTGSDYVSGQSGNDRIFGSFGNDRLIGGLGNDVLKGGRHHDRIYGDGGSDSISGELGSDVMYAGNDSYGYDQMAGPDYRYRLGRFIFLNGPADFQPGDIDWCHFGTGTDVFERVSGAGCFNQFNERPQHPAFPNISFPGPGTIEPDVPPVVEAPKIVQPPLETQTPDVAVDEPVVVEPIVELPVEDGVVDITNIVE